MHHTFPLAAFALTIGATLATFVFPEPITAYNAASAVQANTPTPAVLTTDTSEADVPVPELPIEHTTPVSAPETVMKQDTPELLAEPAVSPAIRIVPFFSQFADITDPAWKKVACGVASLAMLVNYYEEDATSANELLSAGIAADAYTENGWSHAGLIGLAKQFGLTGTSQSLADQSASDAFATLREVVAEGPVMASVHYTFEPTNPIPHLVVITHIADGYVYYNDPAEARGNGFIAVEKFKKAWKQRYIEIRPVV